jgi:hypothetical protein
MGQSRPEARGELGTSCNAWELVEWLRSDPRFDELRRDVLAQLRRPRTGRPWLEYGPEQLAELATGRKRARELLGRVNRASLTLPASLRSLLWTLLLNPKAPIEVPAGPALPREAFRELKDLVATALYARRGLPEPERKRRQRRIQALDTPEPALVLADDWQGATPPAVGMPAAINATEMVWQQRVVAGPSAAGQPVHYTVASVLADGRPALRPIEATPSPLFAVAKAEEII